MIKETKSKAFTLVEIIVSIAITGILMIGISAFFSSTFSTIFRVQNESVKTEKQFVVNEIIRDKFTKVKSVIDFGSNPQTKVTIQNETKGSELPFSYIGKNSNKKLAFKDFLIFNKMAVDQNKHLYANSGEGKIEISAGNFSNPLVPTSNFKNFSSFAIADNGDRYYIAMPLENKVLDCDCSSGTCNSCTDLSVSSLDTPTDIELDTTNEDYLFISDSGNGRVIRYKLTNPNQGEEITIASPLKYPTGLSFYDDGATKWLFIADTLANKILKVNAYNPTTLTTIAGAGSDETCNNISSKFCKLDMPTGLFADKANTPHTLNISDSGNNRILQIKDPGQPSEIKFELTPGENYKLDRIVIENSSIIIPFKGGLYNITESNLIGDASHYTNITNTFLNPGRLTIYSVNDPTTDNGGELCEPENNLGKGYIYINEFPDDIGIKVGKKVAHENTILTVNKIEIRECRLSLADPSLTKYKVIFNESITPLDFAHGETVFPATPDTIKIQIDNDPGSPISIDSGFQDIILKIYDVDQGLVHTEKKSFRIGDGKVGTEEDTIDLLPIPNLNFPTGLTSNFFVNSNNKTINQINGGGPTGKTVNPIDTGSFKNYDYTSDFDLSGNLEFNLYNTNSILELKLDAVIDDQKTQSYQINAAISNP